MRQPIGDKQTRAQRDEEDVVGIETEACVFHALVCTEPERRCNRSEMAPAVRADWLIADPGYDADALKDRGIRACNPGRKSRNFRDQSTKTSAKTWSATPADATGRQAELPAGPAVVVFVSIPVLCYSLAELEG